MTARLFHAVTCTETECDPPRVVFAPRRGGPPGAGVEIELPGCPIGDPRVPGGLTEATARLARGERTGKRIGKAAAMAELRAVSGG